MKVEISVSKVTNDAWWDKLTKEQKETYIGRHPNSKYAKQAKALKSKRPDDSKKADKPLKESKDAGKANVTKQQAKKLKVYWKKFNKEQRKMFHEGGFKPKSPERKKFSAFMKRKAKGVVKAVKHEVEEWKEAGKGIGKLVQGKKLNKHEKQALKSAAIHVAMVAIPMAVSGGLSAGLGSAAKGFGINLLKHTALIRGAQIAAFASESAESKSPEEYLELLVNQMADAMANADIPLEDWIQGALEANKEGANEE